MILHRLELEEFRLYRRLQIELPSAGLRIVGENAAGKSTLVEAIALLATLRSPRTSSDREIISWNSGKEYGVPPYARAVGSLTTIDGERSVEVGLEVDATGNGPLKKTVKVNGHPTRALDAVGTIRVVLFAPEDVALITGPPSGRRRHLDMLISQIDSRYIRSLARYNRVLEQRNSLLKSLSKEGRQLAVGSATTQLAFWNDELVTYGAYIVARRFVVCINLADLVRDRFSAFSSNGQLGFGYQGSIDLSIGSDSSKRDIEYVRSIAQRTFEQRLEELRNDELRRGVSLAGPHRDDMSVLLNGKEIGPYGSRGQQRLAVVALKLAESDQMQSETGETPIVLLDDVLSELDAVHRERLLEAVCAAGAQLILTSTDADLFDQGFLQNLPMFRTTAGEIVQIP